MTQPEEPPPQDQLGQASLTPGFSGLSPRAPGCGEHSLVTPQMVTSSRCLQTRRRAGQDSETAVGSLLPQFQRAPRERAAPCPVSALQGDAGPSSFLLCAQQCAGSWAEENASMEPELHGNQGPKAWGVRVCSDLVHVPALPSTVAAVLYKLQKEKGLTRRQAAAQ